jgi:hypothetical protein
MSNDFDPIYNELIARYGVSSVLDRAACRQVAKILAADNVSPQDISAANGLLSQLPKVPEATPWDLSKLSDRQLRLLERLATVAQGKAPPMAEHRPKSLSYWCAVDAAAIIDRVEQRGGGISNLLPAERTELKSAISMMLAPIRTTILGLYPEHFEPLTPSDTRWVPDDPDDQKLAVEPPEGQPAPLREKSNIVPLKLGNGSLMVDNALEERYPLRHLDPVS